MITYITERETALTNVLRTTTEALNHVTAQRNALKMQLASLNAQDPKAWRYFTPTGWHATTDAAEALRIRNHHVVEPLYSASGAQSRPASGAQS